MKDRSHPFKSPIEAQELAITKEKSAEIKIAVDDAECTKSSSLLTTAERLDAKAREDVLEENAGTIAGFIELRDAATKRARTLLS